MSYDYRISAFIVVTGACVLYAVFLMPALTGGGSGPSGVSQAEFDQAVSNELAYCQQQPQAMDCRCFAQKSGMVLTYTSPKVPNASYLDKQTLARRQAAEDC